MVIFIVYEEENCICYDYDSRSSSDDCYKLKAVHFCESYELAKRYLDIWIQNHPKCEIDDHDVDGVSNAICYYAQGLCSDCDLEPITENEYLKNDYGSYRTCYIIKQEVETNSDIKESE